MSKFILLETIFTVLLVFSCFAEEKAKAKYFFSAKLTPAPKQQAKQSITEKDTDAAIVTVAGTFAPRGKQDIAREIKNSFKAAELCLSLNQYKQAADLAFGILDLVPGNKKAKSIIRIAMREIEKRETTDTSIKHKAEFSKRIMEVDRASIPYIEPKRIKTTITKSAYSQEIREEEENLEISQMRTELKGVLIDLDFRDADLREVIRYLAEVSEINIVLDENALLNLSNSTNQAPVVPAFIPPVPGIPAVTNPGQQQSGGTPQTQYRQPFKAQPVQKVYNQFQPRNQNQYRNYPVQQQSQQPVSGQKSAGSKLTSTSGNITTYQAPPPPRLTSPKITIFLKQIPLLTGLDIILRTKGLKYKIEKDFIWISTADKLAHEDLVTRIYTIQHAIGEFANFETEPLNLSALNMSSGDSLSNQFFNQASGTSTVYTAPQPEAKQTDAKAAEDLISTLTKIISQPPGASMTLYQRTGKLIVRNTPKNLLLLEGLLRNLDVSSLQVSIEVRLIEISSLDGLDIGQMISWNKTNPNTTLTQTIKTETLQRGFGRALANASGGFSYVLAKTSPEAIDVSLQALVVKNRATILSAPKLTCLNNQTANLKIVRNTSYIASNKSYTNTTNGVASTSSSQNIAQVPEGIVLQITPNVSADRKTIRLTVHPQVTELLDMEVYESGDTKTQLPSISQRSLDTTVSVKNSGTLVLGGLMRGTERKQTRGVPILSSIPFLGSLFKNKNRTKDRNNLIIFITASILDADGDIVNVEIEEQKTELDK